MSDAEQSLYEPDLKFYFVKPVGDENPEKFNDLTTCFEKIAERYNSLQQSKWSSERECLKLATNFLNSKDIFVFHKFEGDAFEHIQKTKALVLGPKCMLSCLTSDNCVPNVQSPIYSDAMRDLVVCTSGFESTKKNEIAKLIKYMGGRFECDLSSSSTHMVTNTVMSYKYEVAIMHKLHIVLPEWVYDCWRLCQKRLINAATDELHDKHKVPIFHQINMTSTGIVGSRKDKLARLVKNNGGNFVGTFKSELIHVLVMDRTGIASEKYKAAVKGRKSCLTTEWITDSVEKGYALPVAKYRVENDSTAKLLISTPTKNLTLQPSFNADCTNISEIVGNLTVNETKVGTNISKKSTVVQSSAMASSNTSYKAVLANMTLKQAKEAGPFLDGCVIFLCGFNGEEKEKLAKILSTGSAIHFVHFNANVGYIIVGHPTVAEHAFLRSVNCILVTLDWLAESLKLRQIAAEESFIYRLPNNSTTLLDDAKVAHASPASKKNIASMSGSFRRPGIPKRLDMQFDDAHDQQDEAERTLLMQYAKAAESIGPPQQPEHVMPQNARSSVSSAMSEYSDWESGTLKSNFMFELKVYVHGFIDESCVTLEQKVRMAGGTIVPEEYAGFVDYLILATDITQFDLQIRAKNTVNELWLTDSIAAETCVPLQYYHRPIVIAEDVQPLQGMTIVLTIYTSTERDYLTQLGTVLGAQLDAKYVKSNKPVLLCPKPEGAKYLGAVKWGLPAVKCDWLLACLEHKKKMPFDDYFVAPEEAADSVAVDQDLSLVQPALSRRTIEPNNKPSGMLPVNCGPQTNNLSAILTPVQKKNLCASSEKSQLKHPRISEIGAELGAMSPLIMSQSPANGNAISEGDSLYRFCQFIDTPDRPFMYEKLKEAAENETPVTKQRRLAMGTPDTPVLPKEYFTPYRQQLERDREAEFWKSREIPKQPRVQTPPFSEISKKFWNCFGVSPSQIMTQAPPSTCSSTSESIEKNHALAAATDTNANVKRLSDFIEKNRDMTSPYKAIVIPETAPATADEYVEMNTEVGNDVGWRDPTDFYQSHRFINRNGIQHKGTPRFTISCTNQIEYENMESQILALEGELCENKTGYDRTCTHVVCEQITRSEKIFSSIAAGKWILKLGYIADSVAAGHFLNEELYEWGNPKSESNADAKSLLERAAYRWRKRLQAVGAQTAFHDFRVIIHSFKKKTMQNFIEAGGGEFIDASEPYCTSQKATKATHCIMDPKSKLSEADRAFFKKNNVLCLSFSYLEAYINSEDWPPNVSHYAA